MIKETRSCREFMQAYKDPDSRANCATCVKWSRDTQRCKDEKGMIQRYEDTPNYEEFRKLMQDAKDILIN